MTKKYELIRDDTITIDGVTLYRIRALVDFGIIRAGNLGGYVQSEDNLSHYGHCWIFDDACVYHTARILDDAHVRDNARVYDDAMVYDNAKVRGNARVYGGASISHDAIITDNAQVYGHAVVSKDAFVFENASVCDDAFILSGAWIYGNAKIHGDIKIRDHVRICGDARVSKDTDYIVFKNNWSNKGHFTYTLSNSMWTVGDFHGTGEELIKQAYETDEYSGQKYEAYVRLVETFQKIDRPNN